MDRVMTMDTYTKNTTDLPYDLCKCRLYLRCTSVLRVRLQLLGRSNTTAGVCCLRPCVRRAAPPSLAEKRVLRVLLQRVIQKEHPVLVCTSRGSTHRVLTNVSARVLLLCRSYIKRLAVNIQLIFTAQTKTKTKQNCPAICAIIAMAQGVEETLSVLVSTEPTSLQRLSS